MSTELMVSVKPWHMIRKHFPYRLLRRLDVLPSSASEMIIKSHTGLEADLYDGTVGALGSPLTRAADFIPSQFRASSSTHLFGFL